MDRRQQRPGVEALVRQTGIVIFVIIIAVIILRVHFPCPSPGYVHEIPGSHEPVTHLLVRCEKSNNETENGIWVHANAVLKADEVNEIDSCRKGSNSIISLKLRKEHNIIFPPY